MSRCFGVRLRPWPATTGLLGLATRLAAIDIRMAVVLPHASCRFFPFLDAARQFLGASVLMLLLGFIKYWPHERPLV